MFDNKTLKVQSAQETLFPRLKCMYVCMCVCVCVRACLSSALQNGQADYTLSFGRVQTIKYTQKYVKMASYESIHLNTVCLKWTRTVWRKSDVCQYIALKWQTGASMLIKEQNAKRKSLTALNLNNVIALISINLSIHTVKTMQCSFTFDYF